ncbi:cell wall-associated NlpC family hydrolase [Kitasatospora sp. GP30]|uniref:C40 family peptidase n=1 Tax=Kitasatospora sp. GP30 TaxID=3035084 RepID=UPI000C704765|nr:C40 family peptidase [Kitasatospora sp. GP30]MDH6138435.1 cell wall-associated NlpC family hydrolase [Kitasatospora sp. GP30]
MKKLVQVCAAGAAVPFGLVICIALTAGGASAVSPNLNLGGLGCVTPVAPGTVTADGQALTSEQINNATIIYQVANGLGLPPQAAVVAIATAMQESSLINRPDGDLDSVGLFQQRPSQGWGSPAQLVDPVYASKAFYAALVKVPGWEALSVAQAAQRVQGSLYPDAYAKWADLAKQLVGTVSGGAANCAGATGDGDGQAITNPVALPAGFSLPTGTPVQVVTAIQFGVSKLGMPYQWGGTGDPSYDCSGLMMRAYEAAGITIDRTTYEQVYNGTPVYSASQLKPGDLIFTAGSDGTPTLPGHVGMYLGSDLVLDAPRTGKDIQITHFTGGYWDAQAVAFRRIVPS